MKKLTVLLAVLVLSLACIPVMAEEKDLSYRMDQPDAAQFEGDWVLDDGKYILEAAFGESTMEIRIARMTGEKTFTLWEYQTEYDPETGILTSKAGYKVDYRITEDGDIDLAEQVFINDDIEAEFFLDDEGKLIWKNSSEAASNGKAFTKVGWFVGDYYSESDGVITEDYIKVRYNPSEKHYDIEIAIAEDDGQYEWKLQGEYNAEKDILEVTGYRLKIADRTDSKSDQEAEQGETEVTGILDFRKDGKLRFLSPENPELEEMEFVWDGDCPVSIWLWTEQ